MMRTAACLATLVSLVAATGASAAPGAVDATFGTAGKVDVPFAVADVVTLPDSRVVVGGTTVDTSGRPVFALARYTAAGRPDPTFGTGGLVTVRPSGDPAEVVLTALATGPEGEVVAVGAAGAALRPFNGQRALVATRIDGAGVVTWNVTHQLGVPGPANYAPDPRSGAADVVIQPDGRPVIGGYASDSGSYSHPATVRLDRQTGALDPSFGTEGRINENPSGNSSNPSVFSVALGPAGRILVATGGGYCRFCGSYDPILAYTPTGGRDPGFVPPPQSFDGVDRLVVGPDSRVLTAERESALLRRLTSDGAVDRTFLAPTGSGQPPGLIKSAFVSLALDGDGRILLGLAAPDRVGRLLPDGSLDSSFGDRGYATTAPGTVGPVAVQPNGGILAAGGTSLVRLQGGSALGTVTLRSTRLSVSRRRAPVALRCGRHGATVCAGTVTITSTARKPVTYGRASFAVKADDAPVVQVALTRTARRRLARAKGRRLTVRVLVGNTGQAAIERRMRLTATKAALR